MAKILIGTSFGTLSPAVLEGVKWTTERRGTPGKLTFEAVGNGSEFEEGDEVCLYGDDGRGVFRGYIFTKKRTRENIITVTAYDQIRYLKNKDTYVYADKKASELLRMIAEDFKLAVGTVDDTGYVISSRVEQNTTLLDIIENALDLTLAYTKKLFVLYDDFGSLCLRSIGNMRINAYSTPQNTEDFDYTSSIDENTYNQVKLTRESDDKSKRESVLTWDIGNIAKWGILQYYDTVDEKTDIEAKAEELLSLYNRKTRKLKLTGVRGYPQIRAGNLVYVTQYLGDVSVNGWLLVEKCTHTFDDNDEYAELTVRGANIDV